VAYARSLFSKVTNIETALFCEVFIAGCLCVMRYKSPSPERYLFLRSGYIALLYCFECG
jgi:hypothetical protein